MSYDAYITREQFLFEEDTPPIPFDEWKKVMSHCSDFKYDHQGVELEDGGSLTVWWMWHPEGEFYKPFIYHDGRINVDDPERVDLIRMFQLAKMLNARVLGDYGEVYDEHGMPDIETSYKPYSERS